MFCEVQCDRRIETHDLWGEGGEIIRGGCEERGRGGRGGEIIRESGVRGVYTWLVKYGVSTLWGHSICEN